MHTIEAHTTHRTCNVASIHSEFRFRRQSIHLSRDSFVRPFAVLPLPPLSLSPLSRSLPSVPPLHNPPSPSPQINRFPTLARSLAQCSPHPQGWPPARSVRVRGRVRQQGRRGQRITCSYTNGRRSTTILVGIWEYRYRTGQRDEPLSTLHRIAI